MTTTLAFQPLRLDDPAYATFVEALTADGLPTDDLRAGGRFFVLEDDRGAVAFGGLEGAGADQMLRSVVVIPDRRGKGYGRAISRHLILQAKTEGIERLWLLTRFAASFYTELGWVAVERANAPEAVRLSRQFQGLCPSSAVLMCRTLR